MKKIFILTCVLFLCMQTSAFAKIHQTQVDNVASIRSDFAYHDPELMAEYLALNQDKDKNKNNDKAVTAPLVLFNVYVTKDRFYDKDKKDKYNERINLSITSHNLEMNYMFDKHLPPYLILIDNLGNEQTLHFAKVRYENPFWISFIVSPQEIEKINGANKVKIAIPELNDNIYIISKDQKRIKKKDYEQNMNLKWDIYEIPQNIIQEWRETLNANLTLNR